MPRTVFIARGGGEIPSKFKCYKWSLCAHMYRVLMAFMILTPRYSNIHDQWPPPTHLSLTFGATPTRHALAVGALSRAPLGTFPAAGCRLGLRGATQRGGAVNLATLTLKSSTERAFCGLASSRWLGQGGMNRTEKMFYKEKKRWKKIY